MSNRLQRQARRWLRNRQRVLSNLKETLPDGRLLVVTPQPRDFLPSHLPQPLQSAVLRLLN